MSEIPKAYEPQSVEDKWYQFWLDGKFFVANENSAKPAYPIVSTPVTFGGGMTMEYAGLAECSLATKNFPSSQN